MIVVESLLTWMCLIVGISVGKTIHQYYVYFLDPMNLVEELEVIPSYQLSKDDILESNIIEIKPISDSVKIPSKQPEQNGHNYYTEWLLWCLFFWILALPLWVILLQLSDLSYFDVGKRRNLLRAVCLAPLGAWLRWTFSRISLISECCPTLYPHTILANTVAVLCTSLLSVYSRSSWNIAINQGKKHLSY